MTDVMELTYKILLLQGLVGDIQHNTTNIDQSTTIDKSTKINLPSMDEVVKAAGAANMVGKSAAVVGKSSKEALGGVGLFPKASSLESSFLQQLR